MLKTLTLPSFLSPHASATPSAVRRPRTGLRQQASPVWLSASVFLVAVSVYLLLGYFVEVNGNSSKGYEIKQMQQKISSLADQQKKLTLKLAENSSMVSIQEGFLGANFVVAETPTFLETTRLTQR